MAAQIGWILFLTLLYVGTTNAAIDLFKKNTCTSLWAYPFFLFHPHCYNNPDVHSNIPTMASRHNYKGELHTVTTPDGFFLRLYRLPGQGQPVYLQHVVAMDGNVWVDKAKKSLAFQLADKGYDVWIGTIRAATYGRNHQNLTQNDNAYWDFTLDTHADQDIPLSLEYVAEVTGKGGEIIYLGHSTGCGLMLMFASWQPERASKLVKGIVGLAPVAYTDGGRFIDTLKPFTKLLRGLSLVSGIRSLYPYDRFLRSFLNIACRFIPHICKIPGWFLYGNSAGQFRPEDLLLYFSAWPVTGAADEHLQLLQIGSSKKFQRFDYGSSKNKELYGQADPPKYDLGKVTMPVYMFYGKNDEFAKVKNVKRLYKELGSKNKKMIEISTNGSIPFNHLDFIYPKDGDTLLYPQLFDVLEQNLSSE